MTGYGKTICNLPDNSVSIEVKSINSKQFDLNLKLPPVYRDKEAEIRNLALKVLERGKIEINIAVEAPGTNNNYIVNKALAKKYYKELKQLSVDLGVLMTDDILAVLTRLPDVVKAKNEEIDPDEWWQIAVAVERALADVNSYRTIEGAALRDDLLERIETIQKKIAKIEAYEKKRLKQIRQRILSNISAFVEEEKIDTNRFEQELIYYMEKIDFTEEKVRLQKHCDYFIETINEHASNGRKLGFISQEIGREINTLGSKANDANIQKLVVEMKDELEKIKEQLLNVL